MTALLVMGVSGCGKTTIAGLLAKHLGWRLLEGDAFHPPENLAKMRAGTPLTDDDRWPWLRAIAAAIDDARRENQSVVVACSALKRAYRDVLTGGHADVVLIYLRGSRDLIASRLAVRRDHFMPPGLLDSQFATLEEPGPDEHPIVADTGPAPEAIAAAVSRLLPARFSSESPS